MRLFLATVLLFSTSLFSQLFAQNTDSIPTDSIPTIQNSTNLQYVIFEGDSLFSVAANLGLYSAKERIQQISTRLEQIQNMNKIEIDSFFVYEKDGFSIISYSRIALACVSEADAALLNHSRNNLANEYALLIQSKFSDLSKKATVTFWVLRIGYTLLTLLGLFLIFYLINKLFAWGDVRLMEYEKGLKRKRKSVFRYLAPRGPDYFFLFLSKIGKIVLLATILFFYLPLLFSFLPWTQGIASKFYVLVSQPLKHVFTGLLNFIINKLIFIAIIYFIARYLLRIISYIATEIETEKLKIKGFHKDWSKPTFNIVKILIYAFTLVFMFPYLPGSSSPAFKGVSIFLGVLFSLGSTSAIANIVAGIVITYMRPFQIGDRVKIGETIGDIVEKNLLVTRIKTVKNEDVTIPNATIINTHLWNYTKNASKLGIILHPTVTIGYDVPSQQVVSLLLEAAKNTKNLTRDFKPFVLQKGLNDFYVEYELNVYTKQPSKMAHFYSELHRNILEEFNKANVEILSPHYSAYRDGNASTIPNTETVDTTKNVVTNVVDKITGQS